MISIIRTDGEIDVTALASLSVNVNKKGMSGAPSSFMYSTYARTVADRSPFYLILNPS